jgi:LEA14-like dessication related protein
VNLNGINVTITELRPAGGNQVTMVLTYVNENVIPIAVSGGTYTLYIDGTQVGKVVSRDAVGLPQQSAANLNVTISLDNPAQLAKLQSGTNVSYRLDSSLRIDAGDEHLTMKSNQSGSAAVTAAR